MTTNLKLCTGCNKSKPLHEFHKNATSKDGHQNYCKECLKAIQQRNRDAKAPKSRVCNRCQQDKPSDAFTKHSKVCKDCVAAHATEKEALLAEQQLLKHPVPCVAHINSPDQLPDELYQYYYDRKVYAKEL